MNLSWINVCFKKMDTSECHDVHLIQHGCFSVHNAPNTRTRKYTHIRSPPTMRLIRGLHMCMYILRRSKYYWRRWSLTRQGEKGLNSKVLVLYSLTLRQLWKWAVYSNSRGYSALSCNNIWVPNNSDYAILPKYFLLQSAQLVQQ